jgi:hypothetical protein
MCRQVVPHGCLDQRFRRLQLSIFSASLIDSLLNAVVRKGRAIGNHMPNIEFIVQLLARARSNTVCIWPFVKRTCKQFDDDSLVNKNYYITNTYNTKIGSILGKPK